MAATQTDDIFSAGADVLGTTQDSQGTVLAQLGDVVDATDTPSPNAEVWGPSGLLSRPAPATAGKQACQAIAITGGSNDVAISFRDQRTNITVGPGETCLFAPGPTGAAGTRILLQDGTITITSGTVNVSAGTVVLGASGDKASLDSKVQSELTALWSEFVKVASALSTVSAGGGSMTGPNTYTTPSKSSPGATASAKVQLS